MDRGKVLKVGNSLAVVVGRNHARRLGWKQGDVIAQAVVDDQLVLQCVTQPKVKFMHTRGEYGDVRINRS